MALKFPDSMDDCIYFTRRALLEGKGGKIVAWVFRAECPKCKKGSMGKPLDPKTKKPKIRATEYECPECGYSEEKKEHEDKLTVNVQYTCPHCGKSGETTTEYKRKSFEGVPSYVFVCESCGKKIGITKKMKASKKGKAKDEDMDDDE